MGGPDDHRYFAVPSREIWFMQTYPNALNSCDPLGDDFGYEKLFSEPKSFC